MGRAAAKFGLSACCDGSWLVLPHLVSSFTAEVSWSLVSTLMNFPFWILGNHEVVDF
jgi:hypothetical protein